MAIVTIKTPWGSDIQIDAPEGATDEQIFKLAQSQGLMNEPDSQQQLNKLEPASKSYNSIVCIVQDSGVYMPNIDGLFLITGDNGQSSKAVSLSEFAKTDKETLVTLQSTKNVMAKCWLESAIDMRSDKSRPLVSYMLDG